MPIKPYVKLKYIKVTSFKEAQKLTLQKCKTNAHFIDSIMFSRKLGVVMVGEFSEKSNLPITYFRHWWNEWFFVHAKRQIVNRAEYQELIPLKDYLFRYDRGAFWVGEFVFDRLNMPFNRFNRWVSSPFMKTKRLYRGMQLADISQDYLVQDYCLPSKSHVKMHKIIDEKLNIYPLWILALKPGDKSRLSSMYIPNTDMVLNIGTYGWILGGEGGFKKINRSLEDSLHSLGGRKVLYAHSYYTKQEFWDIYDKRWYDKVRYKYSANDVFPNIYSKVIVKRKYNGSMSKGVFKIFLPPYKLPLR